MNINKRLDNWIRHDGVGLFGKMDLPWNATVIDFGCGDGEYAAAVALAMKDHGMVYAIDKDNTALKHVKDKISFYGLKNIEVRKNDGELHIGFGDDFADLILMYDFIHDIYYRTAMPIRFTLFEEARRVLKDNGVLSITPFHCEYMLDKSGKERRYTHDMLISEVEEYGFGFASKLDGAVHFQKYRYLFQLGANDPDSGSGSGPRSGSGSGPRSGSGPWSGSGSGPRSGSGSGPRSGSGSEYAQLETGAILNFRKF